MFDQAAGQKPLGGETDSQDNKFDGAGDPGLDAASDLNFGAVAPVGEMGISDKPGTVTTDPHVALGG